MTFRSSRADPPSFATTVLGSSRRHDPLSADRTFQVVRLRHDDADELPVLVVDELTPPLLAGVTGRYFADCNEAPVVHATFTGPPRGFGVAPYALDPGTRAGSGSCRST